MSLIVEDGTGLPDANSYCDLDEIRSYAADRGVALSSDDAIIIAFAIKATDYLESYAELFVGKPANLTQSLSWPRKWVMQDQSNPLPDDVIPQKLKDAESQLCIEQNNGVNLFPTTDPATTGGFVVREKIDVIETQYSERISITGLPIMPAVDSLLQFLLWNRSPLGLKVVRV